MMDIDIKYITDIFFNYIIAVVHVRVLARPLTGRSSSGAQSQHHRRHHMLCTN